MIDKKDISVVVQGAIDKVETKKCIKSIRKHLKGAEIILSTWEGSDVEGFDYDILVENKDPGAVVFTTGIPVYNNLNRQLLSTQNGLKKANREYILKLRSDLIMSDSSFLNYFDKYQERCSEYKLFEKKIIIPSLYSRKFFLKGRKNKKWDIPFHPSDFFLFGLNQDIKKYFLDTPLVEEPAYSNYFRNKKNTEKPFNIAWYQYPPEQYFALNCFKRNFSDIKMDNMSDVNAKIVQQSEIAMVNNFIVLEYKQHRIYMNKYKFSKNESMLGEKEAPGLYHNLAYINDYKKYCDPTFKIPIRFWWREKLSIDAQIYILNKHIFRLIDIKTPLGQRLEQLVSIPYYAIVLVKTAISNVLHLISALRKNDEDYQCNIIKTEKT